MMIAIMRRGGRARLKASDSKSDRGVSPSGVQILSPPPIVLASERLRRAPALDGRADNPRGCAGLRGSTVGQQPPWPGSAARRSGGEPARAVLANTRRGDRAAEGAALEMPCTGNPCAAGSNPAPSATSYSPYSPSERLRRAPALDGRAATAVVAPALDGRAATAVVGSGARRSANRCARSILTWPC